MISFRSTLSQLRILLVLSLILFFPPLALSDHKDGHTSEGVGQIDTEQYNCNGLGATECMLAKLDRIERRMGCPLEDYIAGTCPYSPADTTATFCISQGREGGIDAEFGAEFNADADLGGGWPNAIWGKLAANAELPVLAPLGPVLVPIPTEVNITGTASLGRNFNICIEVPLTAFAQTTGLERNSDAEIIDRIVHGINQSVNLDKSKFQRRLGRLANYSIVRVPGTNRFGDGQAQTGIVSQAHTSDLAMMMDDDGESEFDLVEDAIERLMTGNFQIPDEGGPLALLKSPIVGDLRSVLEIPSPVQQVLDDPDMILAKVFELGLPSTGANSLATGGFCGRFSINEELQTRFESIGNFCALFSQLPTFAQTTGIFNTVAIIRGIVNSLPSLGEIKAAACDIAGWNCSE